MRKKILSGMLMVAAMLFATSVFTSCKDTYTDDINQVKGDLQTEITNLKNELQKQINALKDAQDACKTNCEAIQKDLQNQIDELRKAMETVVPDAEIKALEAQVKALSDEIAALKAQDAFLEAKIKELQDTLNGVDLSQIEKNKNDIEELFKILYGDEGGDTPPIVSAKGIFEIVKEATADIEALQTLAETARNNAAAAQAAADAAQAAANNAQGTADAAKTAAAAAQAAADNAKQIADQNAADIVSIKTQLTTIEGNITKLETRVTKVEGDVIAAQAQADAALALAKADSVRLDALKDALDNIPPYNGYTKEEVDAMKQELEGKIAENKMAIEDAQATADKAYDLANKAYDLADDAKTIALQALNNSAINAQNTAKNTQDIETLDEFTKALEQAYKAADEALQEQINDIVNVQLPALAEDIQDLQGRMGIVEQAIVDLQKELAKDVDALKKQITGIIVQGTYNPVFGQFSLPVGANSTMLCALYGSYLEADTEWPSEAIDLTNISKAKTISLENGQSLVSDGDKAYAGKLYLTVNPAEANFTGVDFTLETSAGNQSVFDFSKLKKSTDELAFGWTRAGVPNFYESKAYVKIENLEDAKITKNVNIDEIKTVAKDILNRLRGKGSVDIAGAINTLCNNFSGVLPAYAAKVSVEDPTLGTTTVVSNYNIATTAWKPFSYEFLKGYDMPQLPTIAPFDVEFDMHLISPEVPSVNATLYLVQDNDGITYAFFATYEEAVDFKATISTQHPEKEYTIFTFDELTNRIRESLTAIVERDIQYLQDQIAQQAEENVDKIQDQLNSQFINRINNAINKINHKIQNPNQYLQPTVLYHSKKHGWVTASTVKAIPTPTTAGIVELNATSYTNEIFAPAYKKFVAVTYAPSQKAMDTANNNLYKMAKVIDGSVKQVYCQFTEKGVYEVSFAALDYSGKTVVTKHYFEVY